MKKARPFIITPPMVAAALFGLLAVAGLGVNLQLVHERREMRRTGGRTWRDASIRDK